MRPRRAVVLLAGISIIEFAHSQWERTVEDGALDIQPRIIGGRDATKGRYPYAEIRLVNQNGRHQCGGSMIASDVVLTAGHCLGHFTKIEIGRHDLTDDTEFFETVDIGETKRHTSYESTGFRYDIALVSLQRRVETTSLATLNAIPNLASKGDDLTVVGYGANLAKRNSEFDFPDVFQEGNVKYLTNAACSSYEVMGKTLYEDSIHSEMMCAEGDGVDACVGDSGSPLVIRGNSPNDDVQVGVVSWGRGCAIYPGVYARTSSAYEWIRDTMCDLASDPPLSFECTQERAKLFEASKETEPAPADIEPREVPDLTSGNSQSQAPPLLVAIAVAIYLTSLF